MDLPRLVRRGKMSGASVLVRGGALVIVLAVTTTARADVVSGYGQIEVGGAYGKGLSEEREVAAFHEGVSGAVAYGLLVGVEVLFIDAFIQHDQYRADGRVAGTWTQFMVGFDVEVDLGDPKGGEVDDRGRRTGGYSSAYAEIGTAIGYGVGTGQQVDPPLDNGEVTDKGILLQGGIGVGWRMTPWLSAGVSVPIQVGYLVKSGDGAVANDVDNQYLDFSVAAMLNLRAKLQLK